MVKKHPFFIVISIICFIFVGCNNIGRLSNITKPIYQAKSVSQNKVIPFKYFYEGFVLQNNSKLPIGNNELPVGTVVINTDKEWSDFKNKYLDYKSGDMAYRFNTPADFAKESIIYNSVLNAKPDIYAVAYQIDKIRIEDSKINVLIRDLDNNLRITTTNYEGADHRYIILVTVNKSDLSK